MLGDEFVWIHLGVQGVVCDWEWKLNKGVQSPLRPCLPFGEGGAGARE
jgi:hypothetical protein